MSQNHEMVTVGITGGIGSGKTTVCKIWKELGATVIHADDLARELMVSDPDLKNSIQSLFGNEAYRDDGSLNRPFLAAEAFAGGRVSELNRVVHPRVRQEIKNRIRNARESGEVMFIEEAALLLDQGRPAAFDFIVVVTANRERRLEWVARRDQMEVEKILNRMEKQKSDSELIPLADFVIRNDSTLSELKKRAEDLFRKMIDLKRFPV